MVGSVGNNVGAASVGSGTMSVLHRSGRNRSSFFAECYDCWLLRAVGAESLGSWSYLHSSCRGGDRQFSLHVLKAGRCHEQPCSWVFLNVTDLIYIMAKGCS